MTTATTTHRDELRAYLTMLAGRPDPQERLELRSRLAIGRMTRRFYPAGRPAGLLEAILRLGPHRDVYVGCAPRTREAGGRDAIRHAWVLWADCDTPAAQAALEAFTPAPTLVIASGSRHGRHAYWALTEPADVPTLEDGNRRLARHLGADEACTDAPRILRPPGTRNFKRDTPADVLAVAHHPDRRYELLELLELLPPAEPEPRPANASDRTRGGDPLLAIRPDEYLPVLTGQRVDRDRKSSCPFHLDSTPSLHAYADHWFCFGCRQGGTVYDLAARLWDLETRGPEFLELRSRLLGRLAAARVLREGRGR